jgi:uncharacterized protein (UPF0264 family)
MLPTAVYVIKTIVRAIKKTGRGMAIVADSYLDAQDFRRAARDKYRHMGE